MRIRACHRCALLGILFLVAVAINLPALEPGRPITQYGRRMWLSQTGLPQNTVACLAQTRDGYLWLGTNGGVVRFDGAQFVPLDMSEVPALQGVSIRSLMADAEGGLWFGTIDGRVGYYKDHRLRYIFGPDVVPDFDPTVIRAILEDQQGIIWIATEDGLYLYHHNHITQLSGKDGLSNDRISAMAEDAQHRIWVAPRVGGLLVWQDGRFAPPEGQQTKEIITALLSDGETLWVGTAHGLKTFRQGRFFDLCARQGAPTRR